GIPLHQHEIRPGLIQAAVERRHLAAVRRNRPCAPRIPFDGVRKGDHRLRRIELAGAPRPYPTARVEAPQAAARAGGCGATITDHGWRRVWRARTRPRSRCEQTWSTSFQLGLWGLEALPACLPSWASFKARCR